MTEQSQLDPYTKVRVGGYVLTKEVGRGKIGRVYQAVRDAPNDILACKIIPASRLKDGWEKELEKVARLRGVPNVVQYHTHGTEFDLDNTPFVWILWDFVDGANLQKYISTEQPTLDLAFVEAILKKVLGVLYACSRMEIQHGDLHEGNILISNPDIRLLDEPRTIWISDFGYGGSHNKTEPKDDYKQLFSIAKKLLRRLQSSALNPRDKVMHEKLERFLEKRVLELDPTQGGRQIDRLIRELEQLSSDAERESAAANKGDNSRGPGDYLAAEALGNRIEDWKNLFVPDFLAAQQLLSKNITVLTGARGCGKTMSFRRLTALMDKLIGEPSRVTGAEQIVGFYLNCRDLVEAFPWLPRRLKPGMQQQLMQYFHLAWLEEVCKTLSLYNASEPGNFAWLDKFVHTTFGKKYNPLPEGADHLTHVRAFLESEKEECRLTNLGSVTGKEAWPLARIDFLDLLTEMLRTKVGWVAGRPICLFLDDYTIPTVQRHVQNILNPIVFKRRSDLFFKVSTESTNSISLRGLSNKPLELHQDFDLIDLATESLHQDLSAKKKLLTNIFNPRMERYSVLQGKNLDLGTVLGRMDLSNNELAWQMRNNSKGGTKRRILYHGLESFVGMWSSDIRIMIQMFTDILRDANESLSASSLPIAKEIQNEVYISTGGEFLEFVRSVVDPSQWDTSPTSTGQGEKFGTHLKDIVETFMKMSRYELTESNLIKNQDRKNPKQCFRIEIIDKFDLPSDASVYYEGLIRWHIFLQDWRGKSVRGMITPRLYLNRVLLPFCNLTFSSHDNLHLNNSDFAYLLTKPIEFFQHWKKKRGHQEQRDLWS